APVKLFSVCHLTLPATYCSLFSSFPCLVATPHLHSFPTRRSSDLFFLAYTNIKDNYSSKNTNNSYNTKWENISLHYDYSSLYLYSMYCNKQTNAILLDISFSLKYLYLSSLYFSI